MALADPDIAKPAAPPPAPAKPKPEMIFINPLLGPRQTVTVNKLERSYYLYVPKRESKVPRPLVIVLHGGGGNPAAIAGRTGFSAMAERENFLVAYPLGTGRLPSWNAGNCCGYALRTEIDDVAFIKQMVADIFKKTSVDTTRVYVTGFSNGGMMAYRLACDVPETFAAIGVVAGAMNTLSCKPKSNPSLVIFHARDDQNVLYNGGASKSGLRAAFGKPEEDASVKQAMDFWLKANHCRAFPLESSDNDKATVNYFCAQKKDVRLYTLNNGGHSWPGGRDKPAAGAPPIAEEEDATPEELPSLVPATELIWEFFNSHPPREVF